MSSNASVLPTVKFGIKAKLFAMVLFALGSLIGLVLAYINVEANSLASAEVNQSLLRSEEILGTRLKSSFRSIQEIARGLSVDGRARPLVYFGDRASLQDVSSELVKSLGLEILMFTDANGVILARSDKPGAQGKSVTRSSLFQAALQGKAASGFMKRRNELLQIVAYPVVDNAAPEIVRGTVAVAFSLAKSLAHEIKQLTESEIMFFAVGKQIGDNETPFAQSYSTFETPPRSLEHYLTTEQSLLEELKASTSSIRKTIEYSNESMVTLFYPLRAHDKRLTGFVAALRSQTALLAPYHKIISNSLAIGAICLLIGMFIAYRIARGIAHPLIQLVSVTKGIEQGTYPSEVTDTRQDEVGVLQAAIYTMGNELQRKSELEDYLAGFSDSILDDGALLDEEVDELTSTPKPSIQRGPLENGTLFDNRYHIESVLGAGGMGVVYGAHDQELDEHVALKVLDKAVFGEDSLNRFKQELKLARAITQKNIVRTYDFGSSDNLHYITMEHVRGYTLRQFVSAKGAIAPNIAVLMCRQICSAVAAAHDEGIIHRDLKTDNILINRRGVLKILDFGIAIANSAPILERGADEEDVTGSQTRHKLAGTPTYMAPELFEGAEASQQSDIYALGIVMYFMLTAHIPITKGSFESIATQHIHSTIEAPSTVVSNIPSALDNIVLKALSKKKNDRYASARALGDALSKLRLA